jgi:hypothetical protein
MTFFDFVKNSLSNIGEVSSKRIVTFIAINSLIISFFIAQIWGRTPPQYMFEYLSYIVMTGMGFTAVEKMKVNLGKKDNQNQE